MKIHRIRKESAEGMAHDVITDYRWVCSCGMRSAWFPTGIRRDASAQRHLDKHSTEGN